MPHSEIEFAPCPGTGVEVSLDTATLHRAMQMQVLLHSNRWSTFVTQLAMLCVYWQAQQVMPWWQAMAWCAPLMLGAAWYFIDSFRFRTAELITLGSPALQHRFLSHVTGQGFFYGLMYIGIYPHLESQWQFLLALFAATAIPIGAFTVAAVQQIGLAWVISLSLMLTANSLLVGDTLHFFLAAAVVFMGIVSSVSVLSISQGLRARLSAEQDARDGQEALSVMLREIESQSEDWVWKVDATLSLVHAPPALRLALGEAPHEPQPSCHLFERLIALARSADPGQSGLDELRHHMAEGSAMRNIELHLIPGGTVSEQAVWSLSGAPVRHGSDIVQGWFGVIRDVTLLRTQANELHRLAHRDQLTGLANRHVLMLSCEQALRRGFSGEGWLPVSLFLLDLDDFKSVNDSFGHLTGDLLLKEVASRLSDALALLLTDQESLLARLGGDEFAVLVYRPHAVELLEDLAHALAASLRPIRVGENLRIDQRVSIGVACWKRPGSSAETLLLEADVALYEAKADGGGVMRIYEEAMGARVARRAAFSKELGQLLAHNGYDGFEPGQAGELIMLYQPQIDLRSGEMIGAEALIRWRHPSRGWVSPDAFIPIAEDTGQIIELDRWVLARSCQDAANWSDSLHVAVNVSGQQFAAPGLVSSVNEALRSSGLAPERLEVEITETALMQNPGQAQLILAELRQLGVRIALDDFGTGYSSLAYLATLPVDVLKIDRSFVIQMNENASVDIVVATILKLGHALGLTTLAEGIEITEQATHLLRNGCCLGQGFLYDRALAPNQIKPRNYRSAGMLNTAVSASAETS